jgi:hypothetical protein
MVVITLEENRVHRYQPDFRGQRQVLQGTTMGWQGKSKHFDFSLKS